MPRKAEPSSVALIPLALIDPPPEPIRQSFDQVALAELVDSIRAVGVLEPLLLAASGARFKVLAGHRRYVASQQVGLARVPAVVWPEGSISAEAITLHENYYREAVNPAHEAVYLGRLLERCCENDVDKLVALTKLRREYLEERLLLLLGDPEVLATVERGEIGLGVARELNLVRDRGYRLMYLDAARRGGATVRMVREWRVAADHVTPVDAPDSGPGDNQFTALPPPVTSCVCVFCQGTEEPWSMELVYMHRQCRRIFLDNILMRIRGEIPGPEVRQ